MAIPAKSPDRFATSALATRAWHLMSGGTSSVFASAAAAGLLRLVSTLTLTRLLDAQSYGVIGVITSVAMVLTMLSDVGLLNFIARHREGDNPTFLDEIWTVRLARALVLALLMVLLAEPAAHFVHQPELASAIAIWSLSFLIDGLSSLAFASGTRKGQLWRLSLLDLTASLAAFIISLVSAFVLHTYWALIVGMLGGGAVKTICSYAIFRQSRRRLAFSRARSMELWGFSRNIALSSALTLLIMQADKLLLARLMPLATYGAYSIAVTLTAHSAYIANSYSTRVLSAAYSQAILAGKDRLRQIFYDKRRRMVLFHMCCVGATIGGAPLIVALLYDPRYSVITPFFQLLLISVVLRMPALSADQGLLALGVTRPQLIANIIRFCWLLIGGTIAVSTGDVMPLVVMIGTIEVPALSYLWWELKRVGLFSLREESYGLVGSALSTVVGVVIAHATLPLLPWLWKCL
jgi:O-antigen/teichoic acid export membrane protein